MTWENHYAVAAPQFGKFCKFGDMEVPEWSRPQSQCQQDHNEANVRTIAVETHYGVVEGPKVRPSRRKCIEFHQHANK